MRSRSFEPENGDRVMITGVGRSGTTFLVQLLTAMDFETGYTLEEALTQVDPISFAGLEQPLFEPSNPYVVKSPYYADLLMDALRSQRIKVSYVIVPIRPLFEAAESRRRVTTEASKIKPNPLNHPGGLTFTLDPNEQEEKLAVSLYALVNALIVHRVNFLFLAFPRLVHDPIYCFQQLQPLLDNHNVSWEEFKRAHALVAKPSLIHSFEPPASKDEIWQAPFIRARCILKRLLGV